MTGKVSFVIAATAHGPMIVDRFDRVDLPDGTGYGLGRQLLERGCYDQGEVEQTLKLITFLYRYRGSVNGDFTVLDGGANIGVMTLEWARATAEFGKVIAVEPQERLAWALGGNVVLNNLRNVRLERCALGAEEGYVAMPLPDYDAPGSFGSFGTTPERSRDTGQEVNRRVDVPVRMVDDLLRSTDRLAMLKLDVEGSELEALSGAEGVIRRDKPALWVEHLKGGAEAVMTWMRSHGYVTVVTGLNVLGLSETDPVRDHVDSILRT